MATNQPGNNASIDHEVCSAILKLNASLTDRTFSHDSHTLHTVPHEFPLGLGFLPTKNETQEHKKTGLRRDYSVGLQLRCSA